MHEKAGSGSVGGMDRTDRYSNLFLKFYNWRIALFATRVQLSNLVNCRDWQVIWLEISDRQPASRHHVDERAVFLATGTYRLALAGPSEFAAQTATALTWSHRHGLPRTLKVRARWYESHLTVPTSATSVRHQAKCSCCSAFRSRASCQTRFMKSATATGSLAPLYC